MTDIHFQPQTPSKSKPARGEKDKATPAAARKGKAATAAAEMAPPAATPSNARQQQAGKRAAGAATPLAKKLAKNQVRVTVCLPTSSNEESGKEDLLVANHIFKTTNLIVQHVTYQVFPCILDNWYVNFDAI